MKITIRANIFKNFNRLMKLAYYYEDLFDLFKKKDGINF